MLLRLIERLPSAERDAVSARPGRAALDAVDAFLPVGWHPMALHMRLSDTLRDFRKPRRNGATHLVMTPVQCLARIAALIPPPRFPLQRFSGVFAPRSPLRAAVVPSGPVARADVTPTLPRAKTKRKTKKTTRTVPDDASPWVATAEGTSPERESVAPSGRRTSLGDGVVMAAGTRIEWAQLLRRIYLVDVLACRCGGRRAIVATSTSECPAPDAILGSGDDYSARSPASGQTTCVASAAP